ncbi:MAG: RagB/SusD family nutrient uptake outer membrane protein [Prevotella sp.]|nr:RagB/SusD family nutrient uptake outer membrane protein [Prevotella sp.]MBR0527192.1 RagB/SusD family nutrient uptake outer membrane protein [Prevotella sp.]
MKRNIIKKGLFVFAMGALTVSCTGDLDVTPIDPNLDTPENLLTGTEAYDQLLAKCYSALSVSSPDGESGDPDIEGIDGGFGQYLRALYNLQELPTDEAVIGWNDQTLKDLHGLQWTSSDVFVSACYSRVFYQISICNEVMRRIDQSGSNDAVLQQYRAEARALRGLSYLHAIDLFGNVPFTDETSVVGGDNPQQISRAELFTWLVNDMKECAEQLPANPEKYRCGKGMVYMILAKLYLNAGVYTGKTEYQECANYCQKIIDLGYKLESAADYYKMFCADNDQLLGVGHELIFSVYQDHINTQAYGGTTYIINAMVGGKMAYADYGLGGNGWGGIRVTPQFVDKFEGADQRAKFFTTGQNKEIKDISDFTSGYAFTKFTNLKANGTMIDGANSFPDTDFPMFRLGDVYLMLAECQVVGGIQCDGIARFNDIRERAGVAKIDNPTRANILDERARELAWECHRRSDLVRFGLLTSGDYLWAHKGMNSNVGTPHGVDAKYNLYPLASSDVISNPNLKQNTGY